MSELEAILCTFSKVTDDNGLLIQVNVPLPVAIRLAHAVKENLKYFGYTIVPVNE